MPKAPSTILPADFAVRSSFEVNLHVEVCEVKNYLGLGNRISELKIVLGRQGVYVRSHDRRHRNGQKELYRVVVPLDGSVRRFRSGSCRHVHVPDAMRNGNQKANLLFNGDELAVRSRGTRSSSTRKCLQVPQVDMDFQSFGSIT